MAQNIGDGFYECFCTRAPSEVVCVPSNGKYLPSRRKLQFARPLSSNLGMVHRFWGQSSVLSGGIGRFGVIRLWSVVAGPILCNSIDLQRWGFLTTGKLDPTVLKRWNGMIHLGVSICGRREWHQLWSREEIDQSTPTHASQNSLYLSTCQSNDDKKSCWGKYLLRGYRFSTTHTMLPIAFRV